MSTFKTPVRNNSRKDKENANPVVSIPPSPFLKKLGYGTGVAVYKLERSPVSNRAQSPWAIKKLLKSKSINFRSETYSHRLHVEAILLRKLQHPNIVGFRAYIKSSDDRHCLAMEECSSCLGNDIEKRADEGLHAFPAKSIMRVAADIANALNYLHNEACLLHSDIKSYNILIKGDFETCKLCDFGVTMPLTPTGVVDIDRAGPKPEYLGTRLWSAPEIVQNEPVITTKADIFAYGLVLWEMLSLRPPFIDALDETEVLMETSLNESNSSLEVSLLNESDDKHVDSFLAECQIGTRPELPSQELDDSYKYVLEIFHCCTETDREARPSALDLTISIPQMIEAMGF